MHKLFWQLHPGLLVGLSLFLGCFVALNPTLPSFFPIFAFLAMLLFSRHFKRALLALLLMVGTVGALHFLYLHPTLTPEGVQGEALFKIESIVTRTDFGGKPALFYRGVCLEFYNEAGELIGKRMPCSVPVQTQQPLSASSLYRFQAKLMQPGPRSYQLKPQKKVPWVPEGSALSLANLRHHAKKQLNESLFAAMGNNSTSRFLSGLATGEFADKLLTMELSRFGLQHLMAISGFHFAIVAACLQLLLKLFFSGKKGPLLAVLLITAYYLFLGNSPSIQRAWIGSLLFMSACLFERTNYPLNTLGVALCFVLFLDPLQSLSVGFQLSFGITAAILLFVQPLELAFKRLLPEQRLRGVVKMQSLDKHLYLFLQSVRKSCSLNTAVHLVAFPLTLLFFHKFPFVSLFYNLFFPFFTSFSLSLLLLGILTMPLPPLSGLIHKFNFAYTSFLLDTIYDAPLTFDYALRARGLSPYSLSLYITVLFAFALFFQARRQKV